MKFGNFFVLVGMYSALCLTYDNGMRVRHEWFMTTVPVAQRFDAYIEKLSCCVVPYMLLVNFQTHEDALNRWEFKNTEKIGRWLLLIEPRDQVFDEWKQFDKSGRHILRQESV